MGKGRQQNGEERGDEVCGAVFDRSGPWSAGAHRASDGGQGTQRILELLQWTAGAGKGYGGKEGMEMSCVRVRIVADVVECVGGSQRSKSMPMMLSAFLFAAICSLRCIDWLDFYFVLV